VASVLETTNFLSHTQTDEIASRPLYLYAPSGVDIQGIDVPPSCVAFTLFIDDGYLAIAAAVYWMSTYTTGVALNMCSLEEEEEERRYGMYRRINWNGRGVLSFDSIRYETGVGGIGCQHLVS
jgi:hypothetical protein